MSISSINNTVSSKSMLSHEQVAQAVKGDKYAESIQAKMDIYQSDIKLLKELLVMLQQAKEKGKIAQHNDVGSGHYSGSHYLKGNSKYIKDDYLAIQHDLMKEIVKVTDRVKKTSNLAGINVEFGIRQGSVGVIDKDRGSCREVQCMLIKNNEVNNKIVHIEAAIVNLQNAHDESATRLEQHVMETRFNITHSGDNFVVTGLDGSKKTFQFSELLMFFSLIQMEHQERNIEIMQEKTQRLNDEMEWINSALATYTSIKSQVPSNQSPNVDKYISITSKQHSDLLGYVDKIREYPQYSDTYLIVKSDEYKHPDYPDNPKKNKYRSNISTSGNQVQAGYVMRCITDLEVRQRTLANEIDEQMQILNSALQSRGNILQQVQNMLSSAKDASNTAARFK